MSVELAEAILWPVIVVCTIIVIGGYVLVEWIVRTGR